MRGNNLSHDASHLLGLSVWPIRSGVVAEKGTDLMT